MRFDFSGKRVIVAGGSRGIGRAIALGFAGAGAIIGHIRHSADPVALADAAGLLCVSLNCLVVVAVNRRAADMTPLAARATTTSTVDMLWGDLEEELSQDVVKPLSESMLFAG